MLPRVFKTPFCSSQKKNSLRPCASACKSILRPTKRFNEYSREDAHIPTVSGLYFCSDTTVQTAYGAITRVCVPHQRREPVGEKESTPGNGFVTLGPAPTEETKKEVKRYSEKDHDWAAPHPFPCASKQQSGRQSHSTKIRRFRSSQRHRRPTPRQRQKRPPSFLTVEHRRLTYISCLPLPRSDCT